MLTGLGGAVDKRIYPGMGHTINEDEIARGPGAADRAAIIRPAPLSRRCACRPTSPSSSPSATSRRTSAALSRADGDARGVGPALRDHRHRRRQHRRQLRDRWPRCSARDPRLRVIRFRRNFGQTAAFAAGFAHARGRFIVTSDGDLQNDPRDIPAMVDDARARAPTSSAAGARTARTPFLTRRAAVDDRQPADLVRRPASSCTTTAAR